MLTELNIKKQTIDKLMMYFNMNLSELNKIFNNSNNENIREGLKEINNLNKYLLKLNIEEICLFDVTLARGQNYYTGNVFEVYDKEQRVKGSIAAGGRYDKIIGDFINDNEDYPTVGISFGLSSIYEILKTKINQTNSETDIYIIPMDTESECLAIANNLRNTGYSVEIEMSNRKLKKSLDYVNKQGIRFVIIIGTNELETGQIIIKDMINGKNIKTTIDKLIKINLSK